MKDWKRLAWDLGDIPGFLALLVQVGGDNARMAVDLEGEKPLLWVYGPGESKDNGGGTPFNFVRTCPPQPPEDCK